MIKKYCDHCKVELSKEQWEKSYGTQDYDFCETCGEKFYELKKIVEGMFRKIMAEWVRG